MNVAVFGGSFNPPHVAHVLAAALVLATEDVDELLVIPTFQHPFAKDLAPFEHRLRMCEIALGPLPGARVSRVEEELGGESKTLRTLEHLQMQNPAWRMRLVMGGDLVAESAKWHRFEDVKKIAPPLVLGRVGFDTGGAPQMLPEISSTEIREKIARGDWKALARVLPRGVITYVRENGLYGA